MPTPMGGGRINTRPCTPTEESRNWQIVNNLYNEFNTFVEDPGEFNDTFKVKVSEYDNAENYLFASLTDQGVRNPDSDPLIKFEIANPGTAEAGADETVTAFLDADAIPGYADPAILTLQLVNGNIRWDVMPTGGGGGGEDSYTVLVTATDDVPDYLLDSMYYQSESVDKQDLAVYGEMIEAIVGGKADQDLVLFVDTSQITGFDDTAFRALCMVGGESQYLDAETLVNTYYFNYVEDIAIDVFNSMGAENYRLIRGQAVGNVESTDATFLVDQVDTLASGLDPSSGNPAAQIRVKNQYGVRYRDDDWLVAAYNQGVAASTDWEAIPDDRHPIIIVKIVDVISARSGTTKGTGNAQRVADDALGTDVGGTITVKNLASIPFIGSSGTPIYTTAVKIGQYYHIGSIDTRAWYGWDEGADLVYQANGTDPQWQETGSCG